MDGVARGEIYLRARVALEHATIVPHTDADGLAAGAIALRATGRTADDALLLGRGKTPFDGSLPAGRVAILDWGVRPLERGALFVDHHAPEGDASGDDLVVSGHGEQPEVTTSVLMRRIAPDQPAWLAAVGAMGDLGRSGLRLPECAGAPRTVVARLTALVNAPRRVPGGPVREALRVLVDSPTAAAALEDPRIEVLERCKEEWRRAFESAVRTPPQIHNGTALIRFRSPYQVHPVVAAAWQRRLSPKVVLAANDGYVPERVNFSVRGGNGNLLELLREALPEANGEYAHGHEHATGGSLAPDEFALLLGRLGLQP